MLCLYTRCREGPQDDTNVRYKIFRIKLCKEFSYEKGLRHRANGCAIFSKFRFCFMWMHEWFPYLCLKPPVCTTAPDRTELLLSVDVYFGLKIWTSVNVWCVHFPTTDSHLTDIIREYRTDAGLFFSMQMQAQQL